METTREPSALKNHPQEQIKRSQMQQPLSALLTSAAEVAHGRLEKRVGCGLKPFPHPSRPLFFFFFWWPLQPATLTPWDVSHQFCGSQLSCSAVLREPHRTPGTGPSQSWLTAAAPFQPLGVLSHSLPFQGLLLLQKTCWAAKMCWTEKQEENTLLT